MDGKEGKRQQQQQQRLVNHIEEKYMQVIDYYATRLILRAFQHGEAGRIGIGGPIHQYDRRLSFVLVKINRI